MLIASIALVSIPLLVVWAAGMVDAWIRSGDAKALKKAASIFSVKAGIGTKGPSREKHLEDFAAKYEVQLRLLDGRGTLVYRGPTKYAERFADRPSWIRSIGNFFFGPSGAPNLHDFDLELPAEARRPEIAAALKGKAGGVWRFASDHRLSAYYWAQPYGEDGGIFYLTRISRRGVRALYDFRYQVLKLTLILAFSVGLVAVWVGRNYIRPLLQLSSRVHKIATQPGSFAPSDLLLARNDEMGDLCRDFQDLAHGLQERLISATATAGDLAHDLKSPIATVRVSAELLESSADLDSNQARLAKAMLDAAEHMNRSVDGLILLAKLDQELADEPRRRMDLCAFLKGLMEEYVNDPKYAALKFDLKVAPGLSLDAAPQQLERLVKNVLSNACDFCHAQVNLTAEGDGGDIVITVSDDGPGVPPGNRGRLFERFFSHRPEGTPESTGLGLAIAKTITASHGGTIALTESNGATFTIRLPTA